MTPLKWSLRVDKPKAHDTHGYKSIIKTTEGNNPKLGTYYLGNGEMESEWVCKCRSVPTLALTVLSCKLPLSTLEIHFINSEHSGHENAGIAGIKWGVCVWAHVCSGVGNRMPNLWYHLFTVILRIAKDQFEDGTAHSQHMNVKSTSCSSHLAWVLSTAVWVLNTQGLHWEHLVVVSAIFITCLNFWMCFPCVMEKY